MTRVQTDWITIEIHDGHIDIMTTDINQDLSVSAWQRGEKAGTMNSGVLSIEKAE
jgi:hypothetical protein